MAAFVLPRLISTPPVMDAYGFYSGTGEESLELWAGLPVQYVGSDSCRMCHQDQHDLWSSSDHRTVSCEDCHGPAREHLADVCRMCHSGEEDVWEVTEHRIVECEDCHTDATDMPRGGLHAPVIHRDRGFCGSCHDKLVSRPALFPQVDMDVMGGDAECITCHDSHSPRAGIPVRVPHTLEQHSDCQSCHASHDPWVREPTAVPHTLDDRTECLECHGPDELRGAELPHIPTGLERSDCFSCHEHETGLVNPLPEDHAGRKVTTCTNCHRNE